MVGGKGQCGKKRRGHTRLGDGQVELKVRRELLLVVQPVGKVDASNAAVGVDLKWAASRVARR